jgi:hypothetical protein
LRGYTVGDPALAARLATRLATRGGGAMDIAIIVVAMVGR